MTPTNQDAFATFLVEFGRFREENQREHGQLREDSERRHGEVREENQREHGQLREDSERRHGELRAEMHKEFNSHLRWMIGTIGGMGLPSSSRSPLPRSTSPADCPERPFCCRKASVVRIAQGA